jgi:hypothetical protein
LELKDIAGEFEEVLLFVDVAVFVKEFLEVFVSIKELIEEILCKILLEFKAELVEDLELLGVFVDD